MNWLVSNCHQLLNSSPATGCLLHFKYVIMCLSEEPSALEFSFSHPRNPRSPAPSHHLGGYPRLPRWGAGPHTSLFPARVSAAPSPAEPHALSPLGSFAPWGTPVPAVICDCLFLHVSLEFRHWTLSFFLSAV